MAATRDRDVSLSKLAVVFGGPSPEHDVSILTGLQATRALSELGGEVTAVYWSKGGEFFRVAPDLEAEAFLGGVPRGADPLVLAAVPGGGFSTTQGLMGRHRRLDLEVVVNCCHGGPGEDGSLQAAMDLAALSYTGPSLAGAALGMDKLAFGALMVSAGLPALPRVMLGDRNDPEFPGPYIVKPRFGGSSIGIEVVEDVGSARALASSSAHLAQGAVLEPYRGDLFDLQVAMRSWPSLELSGIERPIRSAGAGRILGYSDKYVGGEGMLSAPRELPASIGAELEEGLRRLAVRVATLTGLRGMARLDFLSDGDDLYVNEVNTIPGSLSKYLWVSPPLSFSSLLADLVAEARGRPSFRRTSVGADGSALRSAGSIANKLG